MISIVIPTIRENCIKNFLEKWNFKDVQVIVVEDNPTKTFKISGVEHYSWKEIDKELGRNSWIISRRNSAIRAYGFLKAYQAGADIIITLDDDCTPETPNLVETYKKALEKKVPISWMSTTEGLYPRGFPYNIREEAEVMLHMGLWKGVPDLDGPTQLINPNENYEPTIVNQIVPKGIYFPLCSMNFGFRKEIISEMLPPLNGKDQPYDRFDDIWLGIYIKRYLDKKGYAATFGEPYVNHKRASDVFSNIKKEAPGLEVNETLWMEDVNTSYFKRYKEALKIWRSLFPQ